MAMTEKEIRRLALMLAIHADELQGLAESISDGAAEIWDATDAEIVGAIQDGIEEVSSQGAGQKIIAMHRLKTLISEIRMRKSDEMAAYVHGKMQEIRNGEHDFNLMWLALILSLSGIRKIAKEPGVAEEVYGEDGEFSKASVDTMLRGFFDSDFQRLSRVITKWYVKAIAIDNSSRNGITERNMRRLIRSTTEEVRKAIDTASRQLRVIVTMAVNGVSNDTAVKVAAGSEGMAERLLWVTELDERVCEDCDSLEGKSFDAKDAPPCPMHPNCRCRLVPVTEQLEKASGRFAEAVGGAES